MGRLKKQVIFLTGSCLIIYLLIRISFPHEYQHESYIKTFALNPNETGIYLEIFNQLGSLGSTYDMFHKLTTDAVPVGQNLSPTGMKIIDRIVKIHDETQRHRMKKPPRPLQKTGAQVNVATIACEGVAVELASAMLKSVVIFSQVADLHLVIVTNSPSLVPLFEQLMELKWRANNALGVDFSFEIILESFPKSNVKWRDMYQPCATQRLFFPELLSHLDSVLYLDADTIVLSNLTEMWDNFSEKMMEGEALMALAPNSEHPTAGHYTELSKIPFYGLQGVNAGVALMNLTRMRAFNSQQLLVDYYDQYKSKIKILDQDIYNIFFHFHPDKLYLLDCSYNFHMYHCPQKGSFYRRMSQPGPISFCLPLLNTGGGVRVIHGNQQTFFKESEFDYPFIREVYQQFSKLNLLETTAMETIESLMKHLKTLKEPCFYLDSHLLYNRAEKYLHTIAKLSQ